VPHGIHGEINRTDLAKEFRCRRSIGARSRQSTSRKDNIVLKRRNYVRWQYFRNVILIAVAAIATVGAGAVSGPQAVAVSATPFCKPCICAPVPPPNCFLTQIDKDR
jgi:hypothetical protein